MQNKINRWACFTSYESSKFMLPVNSDLSSQKTTLGTFFLHSCDRIISFQTQTRNEMHSGTQRKVKGIHIVEPDKKMRQMPARTMMYWNERKNFTIFRCPSSFRCSLKHQHRCTIKRNHNTGWEQEEQANKQKAERKNSNRTNLILLPKREACEYIRNENK